MTAADPTGGDHAAGRCLRLLVQKASDQEGPNDHHPRRSHSSAFENQPTLMGYLFAPKSVFALCYTECLKT